jgi:hypothetical protein
MSFVGSWGFHLLTPSDQHIIWGLLQDKRHFMKKRMQLDSFKQNTQQKCCNFQVWDFVLPSLQSISNVRWGGAEIRLPINEEEIK